MTVQLTPADVPAFLPPGSFARFATTDWDADEFADGNALGRRRKVKRLIKRSPTAPVSVPHNFVLGTLDSAGGNRPPVHSHEYPEIFIPTRAGYRISYGTDLRHHVDLGLYDAISVPMDVLRVFESTEGEGAESQMLSIFDTDLGNYHHGITVPPQARAADVAAGIPFNQDERIKAEMIDIAPEDLNKRYVARFADLAVEQRGALRFRRLVAENDPRAGLRTPHNIEIDYIEVPAGAVCEAYSSACREVFIGLEGATQLVWNGHVVAMDHLDLLSVAPHEDRAIGAGATPALLMRIRDLTNRR